ncbi:MAG: hypothetical protein ABJB40_07345 [Acidobacteriota bacterium]
MAESRRHRIYTLISFVSPVIAFLVILAYQSVAHSHDWEVIGPDSGMAGAFLAFAEIIQIAFAVLCGTIVGLIFAVVSIQVQRRIPGLAAFIFNGLLFVVLSFFIIRGVTRGW